LPIKAVLLSALSLCATFGAWIWIFQDGHGAGVLGVTPAPAEIGIVVLMAAWCSACPPTTRCSCCPDGGGADPRRVHMEAVTTGLPVPAG
jgi:hypothetical protein